MRGLHRILDFEQRGVIWSENPVDEFHAVGQVQARAKVGGRCVAPSLRRSLRSSRHPGVTQPPPSDAAKCQPDRQR
jgi:hypothetical protein